ncbi:MAG: Asp-tRNA(Asn)/Glu-tRNA(Gln) amidotransferase subunit GatC [Patescibacteria group bacterium UBA2163]
MSVSKDEVIKYAELSRIALSDEEVSNLQKDLDAIVDYIDVIKNIDIPDGVAASPHLDVENAMRADDEPYEEGIFTEKILNQVPQKEGEYVKVKNILDR